MRNAGPAVGAAVRDLTAALDALLSCDLDSPDLTDLADPADPADPARRAEPARRADPARAAESADRGAAATSVDPPADRFAGLALLRVVRAVEVQRRRLAAVDARLIAALDREGTAASLGARDVAGVLREALILTPGEARARTSASRDTAERRALTGEPLPPIFEHVARAQAAGRISISQARVVIHAVDTLPAAVAAEHGERVEVSLVGLADTFDAQQLAAAARQIHDRLDPDGTLADEKDHQRLRHLNLRTRRDGSAELTGRLTAETAAIWRPLLDTLSRPRPSRPDPDGAIVGDERTASQRRHDGFREAGLRLLRSGTLPDAGGTPVTVAVTIRLQDLLARFGTATTSRGDTMSLATALRLADEAEILPVVLSETGGVLAYGRTRRVAPPGLRRVLAARDHGCSFPGCDVPPEWTQAHHVVTWLEGGATDIDNLTLLCGHHHRTFDDAGWRCRMRDGIAEWIPPPWIDPDRRPRINARIAFALRPVS